VKTGILDKEFVSPDSALWYLEALYNVEQSVDTSYNNLDLDTNYYTLIPDENGMVDLQQVSDVYDSMVADLNANLQSKNTDYAYLIIGDLSSYNVSRDGNYNMQLISGFGLDPLICYDPFYDIDDWYYGNMLGRLDGQYIGVSDAGQELQRRFNNPKNCMSQGGGYWVSVVQIEANSDIYPSYIYHGFSATIPWIENINMDYYLSKGHSEIIYKYQFVGGSRLDGKDFKSMIVWTNNPNPTNDYYFHSYTLWYGVQIGSPQ
jgi:hypothetical protein